MHIQDSQRITRAATGADAAAGTDAAGVPAVTGAPGGTGRAAPLRVDAQRNLEHVLRAAREVFGELGYGAPMEDVARRARVGVGTVYRRFPSKDVLVRRIAEEETERLTEQARAALGQEDEAWPALARFLRTSAASGAGRLLPPQILRVQAPVLRDAADETVRVPQQRPRPAGSDHAEMSGHSGHTGRDEPPAAPAAGGAPGGESDSVRALLDVVGRLVDRARDAGALRGDVSVADVLLVIATAAPPLPDAAQHAEASARLLDILLEGLRSRPDDNGRTAEAAGAVPAAATADGMGSTVQGAAVAPLAACAADVPGEHPGAAHD